MRSSRVLSATKAVRYQEGHLGEQAPDSRSKGCSCRRGFCGTKKLYASVGFALQGRSRRGTSVLIPLKPTDGFSTPATKTRRWGPRLERGTRLLLRTRFRWHKAGNAVIDDQLSVVFS